MLWTQSRKIAGCSACFPAFVMFYSDAVGFGDFDSDDMIFIVKFLRDVLVSAKYCSSLNFMGLCIKNKIN